MAQGSPSAQGGTDWGHQVAFQILLLAFINMMGAFSRSMMGPVQEAMQRDLVFTDQQVALLQGFALAVPLAVMSVPAGILIDRLSRVRLLLAGIIGMVVSTAITAFSTTFAALLVGRCLLGVAYPIIGIGVYAISSDLAPETTRGRSATWLGVGEQCGAPLAFVLGGFLLVHTQGLRGPFVSPHPWGLSLLVMGAVLIPVAFSLKLLRDPRGQGVAHEPTAFEQDWTVEVAHAASIAGGGTATEAERDAGAMAAEQSQGTIWARLWALRATAIPLQFIRATLFIADGAVFVWGAPLFLRKFHLRADEVGLIIGAILMGGGIVAAKVGGTLVDVFYRRGGARNVIVAMTGVACLCVPFSLYALPGNWLVTAVMLTIFLIAGISIATGALSLITIVIPSDMRGLNLGISTVVGSLFFVGLSPLAVSFTSDFLGGPNQIDRALAIVCCAASMLNALVLALSIRNFPKNAAAP